MSEVYISAIETPDGLFLRIARPNQTPEDFPLSLERKAHLATMCSSSLQADIQKANGRVEAREKDWHAKDVAAG